ncbi:hypothetical protein L596_010087 [Steinernema carpocapsae]|uniref:WAP domain-containing protein n=1 Tax=Steinernema carpocapsae TaxID=34508 RepID=A0A4U5PIL0_STECR|nr:hypothetical protein L596_010087 [Steinernema carpocapsae]
MKVLIIVVFFTIAYAVDFTCDPPCHSDQTCFGLPCQAEPCFGVCIAKPPMTTTLGSTSSKASTKPASTTPVSTTPASTTPASTTPASTTAAPSTTPKATTSLPPPFGELFVLEINL